MSPPAPFDIADWPFAEQDSEKVRLLQMIADEADRGVLCTAEWISARQTKLTDAKS
jgi:hypothetical protein